jgi:hypothetical protein
VDLFKSTWIQAARDAEQSAIREVEQLDRRTLSDPNMAAILDRLANHFSLQVATLQPEAKRRMRRNVQRQVGDSGMARTVTTGIMDFKIPFRGDPISFQLAPANCILPSFPCEVRSDHLFISMPDDDNVDRNVDQFVLQVSQTLEALRAEVATWFSRLRAVLAKVASEKLKQIASEEECDGTPGFPVDRF